MSTYFLRIAKQDGNGDPSTPLAFAYGDLDEITYIARRRIKTLTGSTETYSIRLIETYDDTIGQPAPDATREITAFTGDGDTAALVLKRKLAAERAEQANGKPADEVHRDQADVAGGIVRPSA